MPVLGAGGIGTGRQVAASLALGAQGVWTGSVWLTTEEYQNLNTNKGMTEAFLRATSADTVRARVYTGKPARLLKTGGPRPGRRRARPSRCRCRCRTCWSPRRTAG